MADILTKYPVTTTVTVVATGLATRRRMDRRAGNLGLDLSGRGGLDAGQQKRLVYV